MSSAHFELRMPACRGIDIEETTIERLQQCLADGLFSTRDLASCYLDRISNLNKRLCAVIEINPDALDIADRLDDERAAGTTRGRLHGIPFLVKDNIATRDKMQTTAGSTMLIGASVPADARVVHLLRDEGALLLGHANMSEWASMRATYYAEGYSSRGGQSRNPYNLAEHPAGSSSGSAIAVATNMCAFSLGTETDSSVIGPADRNGVVGIKPTPGLTSCVGVIPESRHFDTVGTFGRTVADAAIALGAICDDHHSKGELLLSQVSSRLALRGARFGVPYPRIWETAESDPTKETQNAILHRLLTGIVESGAEIHRSDIPSATEMVPEGGGWDWDYASKIGRPDQSEFTVVKVDFYNDLKKYLSTLTSNPHKIWTVEDVVKYNIEHTDREGGIPGTHEAWPTGQDSFDKCLESMGTEDSVYISALEYIRTKSRHEGIDKALLHDGEELDALLVPIQADEGVSMQIAATAGYPMITIPVGIDTNGVPFGIGLIQKPFGESKLVRYGSAIEDLIGGRPKPEFRNPEADGYLYVGVEPRK